MLTMTKQGLLGWSYVVRDETQQAVASLSVGVFGDSGFLSIQDVAYAVAHEGWFGRRFRLEQGGTVVARTRRGSAGREFEIEAGEKCYALGQAPFLSAEHPVFEGVQRVGTLLRPSYVRRGQADVSPDVPLPLQVFLLWLVALLWKWQVT